jgi:hypothetical protein
MKTITRRERIEARLEKRLQWAEGRREKSNAAYNTAVTIASAIPFGQPILVGHHSERHARRDAERIDSNMRKSVESSDLSDHHASKAAGLKRQLEKTVFSDDPDAIDALESKITAGRERMEKMKATNKAWKKGGKTGLVAMGWSEDQSVQIAALEKKPFASYELTNLGANLRRMEKRTEEIKRNNERQKRVESSESGIIIEGTGDYVRITFAERPSRNTINEIKAASFYWGNGSWTGRRDAIPESVQQDAQ